MMSAPSVTICSACATAASGERKAPPSENESGVTFSIPMTNGRRTVSRPERASVFTGGVPNAPETGGDAAIIARMCAVALVVSSETAPGFTPPWTLVRNLHGEFLSVVDPPLDRVLGGHHTHKLSFCIRLYHRLRKSCRITIPQFLDGDDAGGLQELGIFLSDSLDAHAINEISDAEQLCLIDFRFFRKHLTAFDALGCLEQLFCGADSSILHFDREAWPKAYKVRDRRRHDSIPLSPAGMCQMNWLRPGMASTIALTSCSPALSRAYAISSRVTPCISPMSSPADISRL